MERSVRSTSDISVPPALLQQASPQQTQFFTFTALLYFKVTSLYQEVPVWDVSNILDLYYDNFRSTHCNKRPNQVFCSIKKINFSNRPTLRMHNSLIKETEGIVSKFQNIHKHWNLHPTEGQLHSIAFENTVLWLNTTLLSKQHALIKRAYELAKKSKKLLPMNINKFCRNKQVYPRTMKGLDEEKMENHWTITWLI